MRRARVGAAKNTKNVAENRNLGLFTTQVLDAYSVTNRERQSANDVSTCITKKKY